MSEFVEIDRSDIAKNELLKNGTETSVRDNTHFILGDKLETIWWKQINHEEMTTGEVGSGYQIDFADGTQLKLSTLQLFSIINDYELTNIETKLWTLHEINKDTWKGTIRDQVVYKNLNEPKVYEKIKEKVIAKDK
tara:strand:+ start:1482 stop:1889 length:408 start_codon:yes stop_codon:yes gene_type:complete